MSPSENMSTFVYQCKKPLFRAAWICAGLLVTTTGCISLAANLIHAVQGNNRPAAYNGLSGQRVAVVCITEGRYGGEACNSILANNLQVVLKSNIDDIELVRGSEIEQWMDVHGRRSTDYVEIGKGVKADQVLAVEVADLNLMNGPTLFRGQADVAIAVYEIPSGDLLFRKQMPEFAFPTTGGKPVTETSENRFRSFFLAELTREIGGQFYPVDATDFVARDATISRF